ncbi:uncharacterized protein [Acropora muricata]|uniref:uncharacterized protein n=1 Tax=Acropora muricata TaxID=159855 RepID=UPI0034E428BD
MCCIRGCPQIGKSLKRLDNHLSRYHKGVTRAMNDRQSLNLSHSNKSYVTCLLPHCGKDVLHLSHHLRNKHSNMKVNEYHSTVDQVRKAYQSEGTKRLEKEGNKNRTHLDSNIENGNSDEILRYLVHNTTPDGVRFFLTAVGSGKTIAQFDRSWLCRVVLGEMQLSTFQCIYRYRKYLTSYYRLERYHPYPEKGMIHSCVACAATERGKCSCPILPKSFYVFCRQKCLIDWNCTKCINFDRGPSHACFDFFHCAICHELYVASTTHSPYPPENWGAVNSIITQLQSRKNLVLDNR